MLTIYGERAHSEGYAFIFGSSPKRVGNFVPFFGVIGRFRVLGLGEVRLVGNVVQLRVPLLCSGSSQGKPRNARASIAADDDSPVQRRGTRKEPLAENGSGRRQVFRVQNS